MNWKDSAQNRYRGGTFHRDTFSEFKVDKLPFNRVCFKVSLGVREHIRILLNRKESLKMED